jgi:hypothetical protein
VVDEVPRVEDVELEGVMVWDRRVDDLRRATQR